ASSFFSFFLTSTVPSEIFTLSLHDALPISFSWIDHRFLCEGFDEGLTRLEKLLYFVLVAVSNQDGVSFYSDARLAEKLTPSWLRSEEHTSELQSRFDLVCRLLLEKKK